MGGDEFLVVGQYADSAMLDNVKTEMANILKEYSINKKITFCISVGIGMAYNSGKEKRSLEELVRLADKEMYQDKEMCSDVDDLMWC